MNVFLSFKFDIFKAVTLSLFFFSNRINLIKQRLFLKCLYAIIHFIYLFFFLVKYFFFTIEFKDKWSDLTKFFFFDLYLMGAKKKRGFVCFNFLGKGEL